MIESRGWFLDDEKVVDRVGTILKNIMAVLGRKTIISHSDRDSSHPSPVQLRVGRNLGYAATRSERREIEWVLILLT